MHDFPEELEFLNKIEESNENCCTLTDEFSHSAGEKLPATIKNLGSTLSVFYRISCCAWGCADGDHQVEWLVGRISNQSLAAIKLIRSAYYDETLVLIRGVGEVANLLQLFSSEKLLLKEWKGSDKRKRIRNFGPAVVRKKLEAIDCKFAIDQDRYQSLCEIGTHPVPGQIPGHFTGTGRPVLGGLLQHVGVYVCYTELSYAVAFCGTALLGLIDLEKEVKQKLFDNSAALLCSLGAFNVTNYENLLAQAISGKTIGNV